MRSNEYEFPEQHVLMPYWIDRYQLRNPMAWHLVSVGTGDVFYMFAEDENSSRRVSFKLITDTESKFNIPHDLKILKEVFDIHKGNYNRKNNYWKSYSIVKNINLLSDPEKSNLLKNVNKITKIYNNFSKLYQKHKSNNNIPLN